MDKFIKEKIALSDKDYTSGTTIFIKKDDTGAGVGAGYTVEIYNNGTKIDTMHKDTRAETLDVIKQYKQQYNTSRSFQNEIEVFVTYPEKDSVYEDNKKDNKEEEKLEASMNNMLMKQAGYIEQLLNRITNPESPIKIRTAEELPMPDDNINVSNESVAGEIVNKLTVFAKKIIDSSADESSKKNDLYNKLKGWLFKISDVIKKQESLNAEEIKKIINSKLKEITNKPEFALLKETLEKSPGNLEGKNQLSAEENTPQETPQQPKAANLSKDFWKFASTIAGEVNVEDVFNYYIKENKIEDRKACWEIIEKDIEEAFSRTGMAFAEGNTNFAQTATNSIALNVSAGTLNEEKARLDILPIINTYIINELDAIKNGKESNKKMQLRNANSAKQLLNSISTDMETTFKKDKNITNHFVEPKRLQIYSNFIENLGIPQIVTNTYIKWRKNNTIPLM